MRVLVVRAREQGEATKRLLRTLGHEAIVAPILSIVPTNEPPPEGAFDAVLVTSRHATAAASAIAERLRTVPIFAVGARSAAALRRAGLTQAIGAGETAADLAATVSGILLPGARVLHVAGRDRKREPARTLQAAGLRLVVWESYAAEALDRLPAAAREALSGGSLDVVLHYSRRSAELLVDRVRAAGLAEPFGRLAHLCLSADVAEAIETIDAGQRRVAAAPDEASLLARLGELDPPESRC